MIYNKKSYSGFIRPHWYWDPKATGEYSTFSSDRTFFSLLLFPFCVCIFVLAATSRSASFNCVKEKCVGCGQRFFQSIDMKFSRQRTLRGQAMFSSSRPSNCNLVVLLNSPSSSYILFHSVKKVKAGSYQYFERKYLWYHLGSLECFFP